MLFACWHAACSQHLHLIHNNDEETVRAGSGRMNAVMQSPESESPGWQAELRLAIERRGDRSVLSQRSHVGPLRIQRPFYPEGAVPHLYLLHPPGGVVGGDQLSIQVVVREKAHALLTTPAANKFYRCEQKQALMRQHIQVHRDACCEWLPQETIVYEGARAESVTRVDLEQGSRFIGWEMTCLGRPAANESFARGYLRQRFELWREGKPLWLERARYEGGSPALNAAWGLADFPLSATMIVTGYGNSFTREECAALELKSTEERLSITQMDDLLVCRYLGQQAQQARRRLAAVWSKVRPLVMQRAACEPRVWNT